MAKENSIKMKREPTVWENIFANDTSDKCLISKLYKDLAIWQWYNCHNGPIFIYKLYMNVCMYVYIYIYIYRERERERARALLTIYKLWEHLPLIVGVNTHFLRLVMVDICFSNTFINSSHFTLINICYYSYMFITFISSCFTFLFCIVPLFPMLQCTPLCEQKPHHLYLYIHLRILSFLWFNMHLLS